MDYRLSPAAHSGSEAGDGDVEPRAAARGRERAERAADVRGPELFCGDCGVAFQRADLLRRHVAAAHRCVLAGEYILLYFHICKYNFFRLHYFFKIVIITIL